MGASAKKRNAAASSDGTTAQFDLALFTLAERKYKRVGVETLDDVAAQTDSVTVRKQAKSSVTETGNAVTWRSVQLWKTLQIWIEALGAGECTLDDTAFVLVTRSLSNDKVLRSIAYPSKEDAQIAAARLLEEAQSPTDTLSSYMTTVQEFGMDPLVAFLQRVCLVVKKLDPTAEALKEQLGVPDGVDGDRVVQDLRGWIVTECRRAWNEPTAAWVEQSRFNTVVDRLFKLHNTRKRAVHHWRQLSRGLDPKAVDRDAVFVQQLIIVEAEDEEIAQAMTDHYGYGEERDRLTREGLAFTKDWEDHQDYLLRQWKPRHLDCRKAPGVSAEAAGLSLYRDISALAPVPVGDVETHHGFCLGGYHRLAAELKVGWHPAFETLLGPKK